MMEKNINKSCGTFLTVLIFSILFLNMKAVAYSGPDQVQQKSEVSNPTIDERPPRSIINLNGIWEFDQTTKAFPPEKFTRKVSVPGLIHLAEPRVEEYDKFFKRPGKAEAIEQFNLYNLDYTPRYSWYRKTVFIQKELENKEGMITIKKSQYVTQVYINGMDMGASMVCYTPVEFPVNKAIK
jgi:beta-galactosidase